VCKKAVNSLLIVQDDPMTDSHAMAKSELINNSTLCIHVSNPKRYEISYWYGRRIELIDHIRFRIRIYFQAHIENLSDLARQDFALGFAYKMACCAELK
jgi:hypothetical protein